MLIGVGVGGGRRRRRHRHGVGTLGEDRVLYACAERNKDNDTIGVFSMRRQ